MSTTVAPEAESTAAAGPAPSGRLNGWKRIASRLGSGVRTVQRWEKAHGLPVHRIGRGGGEIVFAFAAELDRWAREMQARDAHDTRDLSERAGGKGKTDPLGATLPGSTQGGLRPRAARVSVRRRVLTTVALGLLTIPAPWALRAPTAGDGMPLALASRTVRAPASWTLEGNVLTVRADNGDRVFEYALGFEATPAPQGARVGAGPVTIADLDRDGRREVLLAAPALDPAQRRVYCFEDDGSLRFAHQARGSVRFGDTEYADPWTAERVFVTGRANGSPGLWVASAQPGRFPGWLQELGPDGRVKQEYRSDGIITHVSEARWQDRDVVLVGGVDQDHDGASLAIFDRDGVSGGAPAARAGFDCTSCPLGGPREFLVFPRLCLTRGGEWPSVLEAWFGGEGLTVATLHPHDPRDLPGVPGQLVAHYMFDSALALVRAEISREYQVTHAALARRGLLDHLYGPADDARLFPVLRFDGHRFVALPPVAVGH